MEIAFESKRLRTICESGKQAKSAFGEGVAEILMHRLADFRAAGTVKDIVAGHPRILDGKQGQCMVVDLVDGHRIVFAANHVENPVTEQGAFDWERVSRIKILRIGGDRGKKR